MTDLTDEQLRAAIGHAMFDAAKSSHWTCAEEDCHQITGSPINQIMALFHQALAAREVESRETTIFTIMSSKTEGLFDGGDLFVKRKPIEDAIIAMIGYEKYKAMQEAVAALQQSSKEGDN